MARTTASFTRPRGPGLGAVLGSLALACAAGCAGPPPEPAPAAAVLGDAWFEQRGATLGLSVDEARARDASLAVDEPPGDSWNPETARDAASLWRDLCASCHGARGRVEGVPVTDPAPRSWGGMGPSMGFFFGGDKMRAGIYERIALGGDADGKPSLMPSFGNLLSREQIWLLVFLIEDF